MNARSALRPPAAAAVVVAPVLLAAAAAVPAQPVAADAPVSPRYGVFAGAANGDRAALLGAAVAVPWSRTFRLGNSVIEARTQYSLGLLKVHHSDEAERAVFGQVGVTPVLRVRLGDSRAWFVDAGIGANLIVPRLRTKSREFGTTFNFGDRVGIGWRGQGPQALEVALYALHDSNGGIRAPNPGQNFLQLSVGRWF